MLCLFLGSSAHAETYFLKGFKDKIPRVAKFYVHSVRFYYQAITSSDANKTQYEAAILLKAMVLELSKPEYKKSISFMRTEVLNRSPSDAARYLNLFLYVAENEADPSKIDSGFIKQEIDGINQCVCRQYINFIPLPISLALLWGFRAIYSLLTFNLLFAVLDFYSMLVNLISVPIIIVLWPLCQLGVSAYDIYYIIDLITGPLPLMSL